MNEDKIYIGLVHFNNQRFEVRWNQTTKVIFVKDSKRYETNYNDFKANSKDEVLDRTYKMLDSAGF